MPIRESSFRIGSGRYVQEENLLKKAAEEISRFGKFPVFIGDETSLSITKSILEESLCERGMKYDFITHNGSCNDERANEIASLKSSIGYDVVVGVGGGVIMDFAKVTAHFAGCPVINIPTSSATCAAFTPLSVRYTPEGKTVGTMHFEREVDAVLVDTAILRAQPVRLLLAGVFDAMAKYIEIKQRFDPESSIGDFAMGLDYAYILSKKTYDILVKNIDTAIEDQKKDHTTDVLDQVIFTSIAVTGVISGIARGSNQCALAHKFYETTRKLYPEASRPYLHGEIIGVGLILQNYFNGEADNNRSLIDLMKKNGMPYRISDLKISADPFVMAEYEAHLTNSSAIDENSKDECEKLKRSLNYLWRIE